MECERELSNLFICIVWRRLAILSIKLNKWLKHFRPAPTQNSYLSTRRQEKMRKVREVCYFSIWNENWFSYQQTHTTEDSPPLEFWGDSDQPPSWTFLQNGNPTWPQMVFLRSPSLSTFPMPFARIDFSPLRPRTKSPTPGRATKRRSRERESLTRDKREAGARRRDARVESVCGKQDVARARKRKVAWHFPSHTTTSYVERMFINPACRIHRRLYALRSDLCTCFVTFEI